MANTIRIKRRSSGSAGAPSSLANAELAFNEVDDTLYYGKGTGGAGGTATTVDAIGGRGAFLTLAGAAQTASGDKTFSGTVAFSGTVTAPTQTGTDNSTNVATTAFVKAQNYLTANQTVTLSGDATGSGSTAITVTLANSGVSAGTYNDSATAVRPFTVDAKGRVTAIGSAVTITPAWASITSTPTTLAGYGITDAIPSSQKGAANGVATLDGDGKVPSTQLPSYVDDVLEYANLAAFPGTGASSIIYVAIDTGKIYRWSGSTYVEISAGAGNADTATKLATARDITATGDASWTVSFDGSASVSAALTLAASGVSAGTYKSVTVDSKGRVTAGTNPTTLSGYGITDAQPLDATLTALAGVTTASDKLIYATAADTFATADLTSFGRSLIDDADASAARTTLGLGTMATQAANNVSITGGSIDGITFDGGTF